MNSISSIIINLPSYFFSELGFFRGSPIQFIVILFSIIFLMLLILLCLYAYVSFAYYTIAKKIGTEPAWLVWIPIGNYVMMSKMAGMPWWAVLFCIGFYLGTILSFICGLVLSVFSIIWTWKIFEKVGRPGWWALFNIIPVFGNITFFILLGVAAWGKQQKNLQKSKQRKQNQQKERSNSISA